MSLKYCFATIAVVIGTLGICLKSTTGQVQVPIEEPLAKVIDRLGPSVIRIEVLGSIASDRTGNSPVNMTCGTVLTQQGLIVTSLYGLEQESISVQIRSSGGKTSQAHVICRDYNRNLALLQSDDASEWTAIPRSNEGAIRLGTAVLAIGMGTADANVMIAKGVVGARQRIWGKAIQIDARISPAYYGGLLVDDQGAPIGIITPLDMEQQNPSSGSQWYDSGIAFAIPLNDIWTHLERMQLNSELRSGQFPVQWADANLLAQPVRVARWLSARDKDSLIRGDEVIAINGRPITRMGELRHAIGPKYAGDRVDVTVHRNGNDPVQTTVTLVSEITIPLPFWIGIIPKAESDKCVEVEDVIKGSPADQAGLAAGDRIVSVGQQPIANSNQLETLIGEIESQAIEFNIERTGTTIQRRLQPAPAFTQLPTVFSARETVAETRLIEIETSDSVGRFSAVVPQIDGPLGLLLWIQPADSKLTDPQKEWAEIAKSGRFIVLVANPGDRRPWNLDDLPTLTNAIAAVRSQFQVDDRRICVAGIAGEGELACRTALQAETKIRGVLALNSNLDRIPLDSQAADSRLMILSIQSAGSNRGQAQLERFLKTGIPAWSLPSENSKQEDWSRPLLNWMGLLPVL